MRIRQLHRALATIILSAPLVTGCSGSCPDDPPPYIERVVLVMPDAALTALLERCKTQQDCEPLCSEVYYREYGVMQMPPPLCGLEVDAMTGQDVVTFEMEAYCIGGRRPTGYRGSGSCDSTIGGYLARQTELEAASVRAFGDLHDDLLAHGAPVSLRRAAITAAADEVRHARTCARLANRYGGSPAKRAIAAAPRRSLYQLAHDNLVEGCMRETYGAVVGGYQGRAAGDATVRHAMRSIARDEARHSALSWRIHAWVVPRLSAEERRELARAVGAVREELERGVEENAELCRVLGIPDAAAAKALLAQLDATVWNGLAAMAA